jgi:hypothetical protein
MKVTKIEAKNQPKGKPICKIPVNRPRNRGGEDSVTVVNVIGDCAPAAVNPKVLAIRIARVLGAIAR